MAHQLIWKEIDPMISLIIVSKHLARYLKYELFNTCKMGQPNSDSNKIRNLGQNQTC